MCFYVSRPRFVPLIPSLPSRLLCDLNYSGHIILLSHCAMVFIGCFMNLPILSLRFEAMAGKHALKETSIVFSERSPYVIRGPVILTIWNECPRQFIAVYYYHILSLLQFIIVYFYPTLPILQSADCEWQPCP